MCDSTTYISNYNYHVPNFTEVNNQTGQITVSFGYGTKIGGAVEINNGTCNVKADTSIFKFCLGDKEGHFSDTIKSGKITFVK
jgi:hypothetical protein